MGQVVPYLIGGAVIFGLEAVFLIKYLKMRKKLNNLTTIRGFVTHIGKP